MRTGNKKPKLLSTAELKVLLVLVLALVPAAFILSNYDAAKDAKDAIAAARPHEVTYAITSSMWLPAVGRSVDNVGTADVTYANATNGTGNESCVSMHWKKSFTAKPGMSLYISAQNCDGTYLAGTITVNIYVDGVLAKTASSSGPYAVATASGRL